MLLSMFSEKSIELHRVWKMATIIVSVQQVWPLSSLLDEFTNKPLLFCQSEGLSFVRYQGASEFVQTRNEGCLSKLSFLPIIIAVRSRRGIHACSPTAGVLNAEHPGSDEYPNASEAQLRQSRIQSLNRENIRQHSTAYQSEPILVASS